MGLLMPAKCAKEDALNAKTTKQTIDNKIVSEEVEKIRKRLTLDSDDKKNMLKALNAEIAEASGNGRRKLVINDLFFYLYSDKIKHYSWKANWLDEDCAELVNNDKKRGRKIAKAVMSQLTDRHLPLNKRYFLTFTYNLINIYASLDYAKQALTEAGYHVEYKKFSGYKEIVIRW